MEIGSFSSNRNLLIILGIILVLVGCGSFYYYIHVPMQAEIVKKNETVNRKRKEEREVELTRRQLNETKEEIERLRADIARLEKFFPAQVFIPRVLVLIENLALATHIEIETIKPGAPSAAPTAATTQAGSRAAPTPGAGTQQKKKLTFDSNREYSTSNIDFKVRGSFQNIYNFMNELSTFPKLVVVDRLSLRPKQSSETEEEKLGSAESGREIEVGGYVEISANMPLTFYIQKIDKTKELSINQDEEAAQPAQRGPGG